MFQLITLKTTLLIVHDDELGYEIFANVFKKKTALELFFRHAKELLGSFGGTITLKILCLVDPIEAHR
jgi:hypothetical protein